MSCFHLKRDDLIAVIKTIYYHNEKIEESVVIIRKIFNSNVIILKFRGESVINLTDTVSVLYQFENNKLEIIGKVSDKHWRFNLICNAPYVGTMFVKLWDGGRFKHICRG